MIRVFDRDVFLAERFREGAALEGGLLADLAVVIRFPLGPVANPGGRRIAHELAVFDYVLAGELAQWASVSVRGIPLYEPCEHLAVALHGARRARRIGGFHLAQVQIDDLGIARGPCRRRDRAPHLGNGRADVIQVAAVAGLISDCDIGRGVSVHSVLRFPGILRRPGCLVTDPAISGPGRR